MLYGPDLPGVDLYIWRWVLAGGEFEEVFGVANLAQESGAGDQGLPDLVKAGSQFVVTVPFSFPVHCRGA